MVTITNKEIYEAVIDLKEHVICTNGKVKLNRWMASTSLASITALIFILLVK